MGYRFFLLLLVAILHLGDCGKGKNAGISGDSSFNAERNNFLLQKKLHKLKEFSREASKRLATLSGYSLFYNEYLAELLRVRVPGTVGHRAVKEFIIKTLSSNGWKVEKQVFEGKTPLGMKNFTNIIATLYPEANRVLSLAAHYDSKIIPPVNGKYFVAATDSAVPCGILLDLAKILATKAKSKKDAPKNVSPQLIFLDGEEAFVEWTNTDSIYGSRYMADALALKPHHDKKLSNQGLTELDAMDAFVLFDLLGAKNPTFYNFFGETSHLYNGLRNIEMQLRASNELTGRNEKHFSGHYFIGEPGNGMYIEDDHIPFLKKGVPILHLIPVPFPDVWHKLEDDETAIDPATVEDLIKIFRHFVCAYFSLE